MDFLVQDADLLYPDIPIFPNELLYLLASLFMELVIIFVFVRYFLLGFVNSPFTLLSPDGFCSGGRLGRPCP